MTHEEFYFDVPECWIGSNVSRLLEQEICTRTEGAERLPQTVVMLRQTPRESTQPRLLYTAIFTHSEELIPSDGDRLVLRRYKFQISYWAIGMKARVWSDATSESWAALPLA